MGWTDCKEHRQPAGGRGRCSDKDGTQIPSAHCHIPEGRVGISSSGMQEMPSLLPSLKTKSAVMSKGWMRTSDSRSCTDFWWSLEMREMVC